MASLFEQLARAVIDGNNKVTPQLVSQAFQEGISAEDVLNKGLLVGMEEVGRLFKAEEYYVPEVLLSARAMRAAMEVLRPALVKSGVEPKGKVALGTVKGDLHDIGKDLVGMMLEGGGYQVKDLGRDVAPQDFVAAALSGEVQVVGLSALLTTTMENMRVTIKALEESGAREKVKVIVGGAPVTEAYAREIGADGYGEDAVSALEKVKELIGA